VYLPQSVPHHAFKLGRVIQKISFLSHRLVQRRNAMRNSLINAISPWFSHSSRSRHLLAGLSLTVSLLSAALLPAIVVAEAAPKPQATKQALPDGVYLYEQSAQPDQVGQGYFVFESKQGNVVGALYMPRSSFDCTSGKFQGDQLALRW